MTTSKQMEFTGSEIAIIGMAARFPGAPDIDSFWRNLRDGVESTTFFTDEELLAAGVDAATLNAPSFVKAKPMLKDIDLFDAAFFGLSPREAEVIDPQHRLYLENVWEALENAGYDPESYQGAISLYAGVGMSSYLLNNVLANPEALKSVGSYQAILYNLPDSLATRAAYKLNLKGACYTVQTFCSTSLVAVHLACQNLLNYESDISVAGGVSIFVPQEGYHYEDGGVLSSDGHCRAFDANASGTVSGSGLGSVVLKRLKDALADGDTINAIILGTATNNDGSAKVSYTAPSVGGQAQVIVEAINNAGVRPEDVSYIETHGTGTALGDPAEVAALTRAFRSQTTKNGFCALGSVKTNIGHTEAAAGVAGLIKTVLALKHRQIPPSLHFETPNPEIDFANSPFYVNAALQEWDRNGSPLVAGVSSFGMGGTNAHVVMREAPATATAESSRSAQLLVLSARTSAALEAATDQLVGHLKSNPQLDLADVAHTLQVGRRAFSQRRIVACQNTTEAIAALESRDPKRVFTTSQDKRDTPVVFMFSGQGAQYVQMGRGLYEEEPTFRAELDRCADILLPELAVDLRHVLYPESKAEAQASEQLKQTQLTQPALFALEYALAKLWMNWGVTPSAMIGHSIGEYVAACLAGVFTLEEALSLVAARGRLMQSLPAGSMLSVPLAAPEMELLLGQNGFGPVSVAAINGPALTVVSGPTEAIEHLESDLASKGLACRRLHTSHAFHSAMMDPILEPFKERVRRTNPKAPTIPFVSNLTGRWITEAEVTDPEYWANHLRHAVRFTEGLTELTQQGQRIFLEVGPGQTLSTLAKQHFAKGNKQSVVSSLRHPQEPQSDQSFLLNSLGRLWTAGTSVDWAKFHADEQRQRVPLPTYPFERRRYWVSAPKESPATPSLLTQLSKRLAVADWTFVPSWKRLPLPQPVPIDAGGAWLLFAGGQVGAQLIEKLTAAGQEVVVVTAGDKFSQITGGKYEIDPRRPEDYSALIKELLASNSMPRRVVHLWSVTESSSETELDFTATQDRGFYSLVALAQAIGEHDLTTPLSLWVVTNNLQDVNGSEDLQPEKATVLGACKVIPQEYQNIKCRSIDVQTGGSGESIAEQLLAEFNADSTEPLIAYRRSYRWAPTFEPIRLDDRSASNLRLRSKGTYLITGGMGGIGLVLAEHLVRAVEARVILIGRSFFPERSQWNEWLQTHPEQDSVSRKIRKLQELEGLGGAVQVFSADVADVEQMRQVVGRGSEAFGEIHGVIHAAGVAGGGIIQYKTREVADNVMRPKVGGARVLEQLFSGTGLDFFILCSSLASLVGGFGQVDYCAANSFLDVFAQQKRNRTYTTAINWDVWGDVGMAVETEVPADMRARRLEELKNGISTAEGLTVFDRILASDFTQVAVATRDLRAIVTQLSQPERAQEISSEPEQVVLYPRPELGNEYVAPTNEVEEVLARIWAELLGVEQVGIHDNFFDLGGHSLLGTQLLSRLQQKFQVEIPLRTLFETQTVAGLAEIISRMQQENESEEAKLLKMIEALADDQVDELLK